MLSSHLKVPQTLDEKARLKSPAKNKAYYDSKAPEIKFELDEGKAIKMIFFNSKT